ncbi:MAG: hypothetical protein HY921_03940 [Elusimicrobia bacterium]|nr:hypothetical protein [Elusimicrobiota bacterium]
MPGERSVKPLLVYAGDCGFCRLWVERWRQYRFHWKRELKGLYCPVMGRKL